MTELIGWFAAAALLTTTCRQVYTQWRAKSSKGLSRWLFVGQITASVAFVVYSWLLGNWVFVVTNALMLVTAVLGQWIYLTNRQQAAAGRFERPAPADNRTVPPHAVPQPDLLAPERGGVAHRAADSPNGLGPPSWQGQDDWCTRGRAVTIIAAGLAVVLAFGIILIRHGS
jgi:MtN3 and saliva related transmembrane protein